MIHQDALIHAADLVKGVRRGCTAGAPSEGQALAIFCHRAHRPGMGSMNISLPDSLKAFVDEQVSVRGYGTASEYMRELIRRDQARERLRGLLLDGVGSSPDAPADEAYFESLRERIRSDG